jgi:hypothetical protein
MANGEPPPQTGAIELIERIVKPSEWVIWRCHVVSVGV